MQQLIDLLDQIEDHVEYEDEHRHLVLEVFVLLEYVLLCAFVHALLLLVGILLFIFVLALPRRQFILISPLLPLLGLE